MGVFLLLLIVPIFCFGQTKPTDTTGWNKSYERQTELGFSVNDSASKILTKNQGSPIRYGYDAIGRLVITLRYNADTAIVKSHKFDADGNMIRDTTLLLCKLKDGTWSTFHKLPEGFSLDLIDEIMTDLVKKIK